MLASGAPLSRRPVFDIEVRAEKSNPYTRYSYNEMLKQLFSMGVFAPENASAAMILLDAMDFPGIERVRARVAEQANEEVDTSSKPSVVTHTPVDTQAQALARAQASATRVRDTAMAEAAL